MKDSPFYDDVYRQSAEYQGSYRNSRYFNLWTGVIALLPPDTAKPIVDIGCGPGQFARMLYDNGFLKYTGLDFSPFAIECAKERNTGYDFEIVDINSPDLDRYLQCVDAVYTLIEVLEHIDEDISLLNKIPEGAIVVASVPTYESDSHVRVFPSLKSVVDRYSQSLKLNFIALHSKVFVFRGVRGNIS